MPKTIDPFEDYGRHLLPLPDSTLRDLARNEAAPRDYRLKATEILYHRKSPYVKHEDLREFVHELEIELEGIVFEHPAPSQPMTSGVTTQTLYGEPFDEHGLSPNPPESPEVREANVRLVDSVLKANTPESAYERDQDGFTGFDVVQTVEQNLTIPDDNARKPKRTPKSKPKETDAPEPASS